MIIDLTASILTLFTVFGGAGTSSAQSTNHIADLQSEKSQIVEVSNVNINSRAELEEFVRKYFEGTPILAEVAKCESTFRHSGLTGNTIRGIVNNKDVGLMQINESYHLEQSQRLGYDIHDLVGNMEYAKYLYEKEGLKPWRSSSKCWMQSEMYKSLSIDK